MGEAPKAEADALDRPMGGVDARPRRAVPEVADAAPEVAGAAPEAARPAPKGLADFLGAASKPKGLADFTGSARTFDPPKGLADFLKPPSAAE